MAELFAIAVPIVPGKEEEWKKWFSELKEGRYNDFVDSRKSMKVHERTFLQHTPMGDMIIVTLEGDDPQTAFTKFGAGDSEFAKWFREGIKNIHGIDLTQPLHGSLPELIMDSHPVEAL